jgi:hypothetical protein
MIAFVCILQRQTFVVVIGKIPSGLRRDSVLATEVLQSDAIFTIDTSAPRIQLVN